MADWIKINHTLLRTTKMRMLMRELKCKRHTALGIALQWLIWIDEQTRDGQTNLTPAEIDDELDYEGAAGALVNIGWAGIDDQGFVYAVDFGKHCGATAKARALAARRASKCKAKKEESETDEIPAESAEKVTVEALPECDDAVTVKPLTEKKRKEKNNIGINREPNNTTVVLSVDEPHEARSGKKKPDSAEEVLLYLRGYGLCSLRGEALAACAASFFDSMEAVGWTARNGAPLFDWEAAARKFCRTWQQNEARAAIAGQQPIQYRSDSTPDYSL